MPKPEAITGIVLGGPHHGHRITGRENVFRVSKPGRVSSRGFPTGLIGELPPFDQYVLQYLRKIGWGEPRPFWVHDSIAGEPAAVLEAYEKLRLADR